LHLTPTKTSPLREINLDGDYQFVSSENGALAAGESIKGRHGALPSLAVKPP
jgi:hypothetical protein